MASTFSLLGRPARGRRGDCPASVACRGTSKPIHPIIQFFMIHPFMYSSIHPTICLSIHPFVYLSINPSIIHLWKLLPTFSIPGSTAFLSWTSGPFNTIASPSYDIIFNGNNDICQFKLDNWQDPCNCCQLATHTIFELLIQVRHPFERLVSAYQSKVVRSTDEWYLHFLILNDPLFCAWFDQKL